MRMVWTSDQVAMERERTINEEMVREEKSVGESTDQKGWEGSI